MPKYRKKPIVIEAVQITAEMFDVNERQFMHLREVVYRPKEKKVEVHTKEGIMSAGIGDWIITGIEGEKYPCDAAIFAKTYDPVEEVWAELPKTPDDEVLIWSLKRRAWWKQNKHGYTDDPDEAGLFKRSEAEEICTYPKGIRPTSEIYEVA